MLKIVVTTANNQLMKWKEFEGGFNICDEASNLVTDCIQATIFG
jgi:hypothetical protein